MSPIPEDFEQLRRLLALKRHEQPPPGYFHGFSRQVIVRLQAGDLGDPEEASIWSFGGGSLLQRIWATLDARPILAGAFGVAVCGFFVVGALISDNTSIATANQLPSQPVQLGMGQPSPMWEQTKTETEFPSTVGAGLVPTYQPPPNSLFEEFRKAQNSRQLSPQSAMPTPVSVSFSNP
jgi:hypothetical protein